MKFKWLLILISILLLLILAGFVGSHNAQLVTVNYLLAVTEIKLSWLMAISVAIGLIFSLLVFIPYVLRLKWQLNMLKRKHKKVVQESSKA